MYKYLCVLFLLTGFVQVEGKTEEPGAEDFSSMSAKELGEAFILAVKRGDSEEVRKLIEAGADIHQKLTYIQQDYDWDYDVTCTALQYAAGHGDTDIVKAIMQENPGLDDIHIALIYAVKRGDVNVVKELLKTPGINVNYKNGVDGAVLITAIKKGCLGVVEELIRAGADVNCVDEYGNTPLIVAVDYACSLSQYSRQAQEKCASRWKQRAEIIKSLLKARADINHANKNGDTALIIAVEEHDFDAVKNILQDPVVNVNHVNNDGDTALIIAIKNVRYSYVEGDSQGYHSCVNSQNILEILAKAPGVDLFHINKNGDTAITLLIELGERMKH